MIPDTKCQVHHVDYGEDLLALHSTLDSKDAIPSSLPAPLSMTPIDMLSMAVPGTPGEDYPILATVPPTAFSCDSEDRIHGGYYADVEADCQPFHICADLGDGTKYKYSFLCPNGTMFSQAYFICDWWFNVDCSASESFYSLNEEVVGGLDIGGIPNGIPNGPNFRSSQSQRKQDSFRANSKSSSIKNLLNIYNPNRSSNRLATNSPSRSKNKDIERNFQDNKSHGNSVSGFGARTTNLVITPTSPTLSERRSTEATSPGRYQKPNAPSNLNKNYNSRNSNLPRKNVLSNSINTNEVTKFRDYETEPTHSRVKPNHRLKNDNPTTNKKIPSTLPKTVFPNQRPHNKRRQRPTSSSRTSVSNRNPSRGTPSKKPLKPSKVRSSTKTNNKNRQRANGYNNKPSAAAKKPLTLYGAPPPVDYDDNDISSEAAEYDDYNQDNSITSDYDYSIPTAFPTRGNEPSRTTSTGYGVSSTGPVNIGNPTSSTQLDSNSNVLPDYDYGLPSVTTNGASNNPNQLPSTSYGLPLADPVGTVASNSPNVFEDGSSTLADYDYGSTQYDTYDGGNNQPSKPPTGYGIPLADPVGSHTSSLPSPEDNGLNTLPSYGTDFSSSSFAQGQKNNAPRVPPTGYGVPLAGPIGTDTSNAPNSIGSNTNSLPSYGNDFSQSLANGGGNSIPRRPSTGYGVPLANPIGTVAPDSGIDSSNYDYDGTSTALDDDYDYSTSSEYSTYDDGDYSSTQGGSAVVPSRGYGVPLAKPISSETNPTKSTGVGSPSDDYYSSSTSQENYDDYDQNYDTSYDENSIDYDDEIYSTYEDDDDYSTSENVNSNNIPSTVPSSSIGNTPYKKDTNNRNPGAKNTNSISTEYGLPLAQPLGPTSTNGKKAIPNVGQIPRGQQREATDDYNLSQTTRIPLSPNKITDQSSLSTQTQRTTFGSPLALDDAGLSDVDGDVNFVTPRTLQSNIAGFAGQNKPLPTSYGVPLAPPIGAKDVILDPNGNVGTANSGSSIQNTGKAAENQSNNLPKGNSPQTFVSNNDVIPTAVQGNANTNVFGTSSSAVGAIESNAGTGNYVGTTPIQPVVNLDSKSQGNGIAAVQPFGSGTQSTLENELKSLNLPNSDNIPNESPNQFQVITSLDAFKQTPNNPAGPNIQSVGQTQSPSSEYTGASVGNSVTSSTFQPTAQSFGGETTYDSSLDTYGSPGAGPLNAQSDNGASNQVSVDDSYGAPLADPLVQDGYGAPQAAPISTDSYGAPLAQPISQSSYGAPIAAPLSRYQSKKNWSPSPRPPPPSINPFKSNSYGRAKRLSRYRNHFRNLFKRRFPIFNFLR